MGLFSKLFSSPEKNKTDEEFDQNINALICEACLRGVGYSNRIESINNSILSVAKTHPMLSQINYTENYFHEESIFYLMTVLELQETYKYIDSIIKILAPPPELEKNISYDQILPNLKLLCMDISKQRILQLNIPITTDTSSLSKHFDSRYFEYKDAQLEHIQCSIPVPEGSFSLGLSPRNHPLNIYLGKISDNIASSVNISHDKGIILSFLEISLLNTYMTILKIGLSHA